MKKYLLLTFSITVFWATGSHAQIVNIPDANFKAALLSQVPDIDMNGDGEIQLTEAQSTSTLNISNRGIANLRGIEAFENLMSLFAPNNLLTVVDISSNSALTDINFQNNQLGELNVSVHVNLRKLVLAQNQLSSLDISSNDRLEILSAGYNNLTALNVNNNSSLITLVVQINQLKKLDVSENPRLKFLDASSNLLTKINLNNNQELEHLSLRANQIENLDVSQNLMLTTFDVSQNPISGGLDLSQHSKLSLIQVSNTQLSELNIANGNNQNMSNTDFDARGNDHLNCIQVDEVIYAETTFNQIDTHVSFSKNCNPSVIAGQAIFECVDLSTVEQARFTRSDLTGGQGSGVFDFTVGSVLLFQTNERRYGKLLVTAFAGSQNSRILFDYETYAANGTIYSSGSFAAFAETDLDEGISPAITVAADLIWANATLAPQNGARFHVFDGLVDIPDPKLKIALLNHNPKIDTNGDGQIHVCEAKAYRGTIDISEKDISDLTGIGAFINTTILLANDNFLVTADFRWNKEMIVASIRNNRLITVDVTNNSNLSSLSCDGNQLTALNLTKNLGLISLSCSSNQLRTIDLTNNVSLAFLDLSENKFSSLDISKNTDLRKLFAKSNELKGLKTSQNSKLEVLDLENNKLANLDISRNPLIHTLTVSVNQLSKLNLTKNPHLRWLRASENILSSIDFPSGASLLWVILNNNSLNSLDFTKYTKLQRIWVRENELMSLNIANGSNDRLRTGNFDARDNRNLNCIQVDDASYAEAVLTQVDAHASFSETSCSGSRWYEADLDIDEQIPQPYNGLIYPNPTSEFINFHGQLSSESMVKIYDIQGTQVLMQKVGAHSQISIANIKSGLYFLELTTQDITTTTKILIRR